MLIKCLFLLSFVSLLPFSSFTIKLFFIAFLLFWEFLLQRGNFLFFFTEKTTEPIQKKKKEHYVFVSGVADRFSSSVQVIQPVRRIRLFYYFCMCVCASPLNSFFFFYCFAALYTFRLHLFVVVVVLTLTIERYTL